MQDTLAIIKPDAVARDLAGEILAAVQAAGLRIVGLKMLRLSKAQAQGFYAVHLRAGGLRRVAGRGRCGPLPGADGRHKSGAGRTRHLASQIRAEP